MSKRASWTIGILSIAGLFLAAASAQVPQPEAPANTPGANARGGARARGPGGPGRTCAVIPITEPANAPLARIDNAWYGRHLTLVNLAKQGNIDLYLEGDSITDNWGTNGAYAESYQKYFSGWKTADFGIGGDRTEHVLFRIKNGELDNVKPKVIVLLIGTNNLPKLQYSYAQDTTEQTAKAVKDILDVFKEKQPQAKVLMVSVFPREDQPEADDMNGKVVQLNGLISKFADGTQIKFLDIYSKFLDANGKVVPALMQPDKLHPVAAGYEVWGEAMKPILTEWLRANDPASSTAVAARRGNPAG